VIQVPVGEGVQAMLSLVLDGSLRERLGERAREVVTERFGAEKQATLLSAVLQNAGETG